MELIISKEKLVLEVHVFGIITHFYFSAGIVCIGCFPKLLVGGKVAGLSFIMNTG